MLDHFPERRGEPDPSPRPAVRRPPVGCPRCGAALGDEALDSGPKTCFSCGTRFEAVRFDPPLGRVEVAGLGEAGPEAGTACANHEGNLATTHCGRCGLLICDLCRIEADGTTLCPQCFARLSGAGTLASTRGRILDYTGLSLVCSLGGLMTCLFSPVLGPVGGWLALRSFRQRRELGEPVWGPVAALVVAVLSTLAGLAYYGFLVWGFTRA